MSADNFYVIVRHPNGGFTPIMGFASDEEFCAKAEEWMHSFDNLEDAYSYATEDWTEYGVRVDPECYVEMHGGISFTAKEKELLQVLLRNAQDESYFNHLFNKELESIIRKVG